MAMQDFRKLRVWAAAHQVTLAAYRITGSVSDHAPLPSGRALWLDFPDKTVGRLRLCEHRGRMRPRQPQGFRAVSPCCLGIGQRARVSLDPGLGSRTRGPDWI